VHVITLRRLREFWSKHSNAESPLRGWFQVASRAQWGSLPDVRRDFPSADYVAPFTVFDIGGNNYRLVAKIEYKFGKLYIFRVFTHSEYDRWEAKP
jgi:mRNA interferase HigB